MAISGEEKIKQLIELEAAKRKEIADKKKELEKKKKEVEDLERAGQKEISAARREVDEQIEELVTDEQKRFIEAEDKRRRTEETLETRVGAQEELPKFKGYGDAVDEVLRGNSNFYTITNYNVMNRLETLASEAGNRPLTAEEKNFIEIVEYHANNLAKDDFYKDKQGANYLKQELAKIDVIHKMAKDSTEYKT